MGERPDDVGASVLPAASRYQSPDGRYSFQIEHATGPIYRVTEIGYADDASGERVAEILGSLLDRVEEVGHYSRAYLCVDYRNYRGNSGRTRKLLMRDVVSRPTLGYTAFFGSGFVTRAVATLLRAVVPRLRARGFPDEDRAMSWLASRVERDAGGPLPGAGEPTAGIESGPGSNLQRAALATFLLRHADHVDGVVLAGVRRRIVHPPGWAVVGANGQGEARCDLIGDDTLRLTWTGALDDAALVSFRELERMAATDVGSTHFYALFDIHDAVLPKRIPGGLAYRGAVVVGRGRGVDALLGAIVSDGLSSDDVGHAADAESGQRALDAIRERSEAELRAFDPPDDPERLRDLAERQHRALLRHREALDRLFEIIGQVSWYETYDTATDTPPPLSSSPHPDDDAYWAVAGALHMMRSDMAGLLAERDRRVGELREAQRAAEEANRSKGRFLGVVSHELRTPLNAIVGLVSVLENSRLDVDQRHQLDGIHIAARRLERLVDDLLDFTRLEAGALQLADGSFELRAAIDEVEETFAGRAASRGLEFRRRESPDPPEWVRGDADRLLQVLSNLMDNAVKFTEQGHVSLLVEGLDETSVRFRVVDSGRGIDVEDQQRIFERFERLGAVDGPVTPGVGLGLAISRELVRMMGGELTVDSAPGRGSTFSFAIPLPRVGVPEEASEDSELSENRLRGARVLLVEDDAWSRYATRQLLEGWGLRVITAEDGEEALESFREQWQDLDVMILDVQLPSITGLECLDVMRAMDSNVRAILCSGTELEPDQMAALEEAGYPFLGKPMRPDVLKRALASLLPIGALAVD